MARRVFFSFHYDVDNWRAAKVRNMGVVEKDRAVTDNAWETVRKGDDAAIKRWIDGQIQGKSCTIVLIGAGTAGRKWINYEIEKSWNEGKGLIGIHIHKLTDANNRTSIKGASPFSGFTLSDGKALQTYAPTFDPPGRDSAEVYASISANLEALVDQGISLRS